MDQAKVDGAHSIESGVWGPHGRKVLAHRADVLLHASFQNGIFLDRKDARAYLVNKYLEERRGVLDAVEVGWYLEPAAEDVPVVPGCGVLVDLGRGEALGFSRMSSIVCSRRFAADSGSTFSRARDGGR